MRRDGWVLSVVTPREYDLAEGALGASARKDARRMGLPYVLNNGNLGRFLGEIVTAPVPAKVDSKYLQTRGYTGANDKYLVAFLKNLTFIDNEK